MLRAIAENSGAPSQGFTNRKKARSAEALLFIGQPLHPMPSLALGDSGQAVARNSASGFDGSGAWQIEVFLEAHSPGLTARARVPLRMATRGDAVPFAQLLVAATADGRAAGAAALAGFSVLKLHIPALQDLDETAVRCLYHSLEILAVVEFCVDPKSGRKQFFNRHLFAQYFLGDKSAVVVHAGCLVKSPWI